MAVPLTPVVLIGAALTISMLGAILGLPVLFVTARPWWACLSVGLGRKKPTDWPLSLGVHLVVCLIAACATYVGFALEGLDDLDAFTDVAYWAVITAMLVSALYGGVRLLRL